MKKPKKVKLHDHTCPENWAVVEKTLNRLLEELEKLKK